MRPSQRPEKKRAVERAFHQAIEAINGEVKVVDLPRTMHLLRPRLTRERYKVRAFKTGFKHLWHGDVTGNLRGGRHAGAILTTLSRRVIVGEEMHAFERAALRAGNRTVMFDPDETNLDADLPDNITSFAKLVLHRRGGKAVLFLTTLQKTTAWSFNKRRQVDKREGEDGIDRHLIHIALAEKVAEEMRKRGVTVELHVPAPQHIVEQKYAGPFKTLGNHFKPSTLNFTAYNLRTVNLSAPRAKPLV